MANVDAPFGLRPIKHRNGSPWNGAFNAYYVPDSYGTALFIGDPVVRVAAGSNTAEFEVPGGKFPIGTLPAVNKATAGDANPITGVIVGFGPDPDGLSRIYNPATTSERLVYVCDDPDVIFEIQADGAIPAASIGLNANLIFTHSGSTVTGMSGVELDTTSDAPEVNGSNQLTILRMVNRVGNTPNLIHNTVEVRINNHTEVHGVDGI